jgi:hypothetical protein
MRNVAIALTLACALSLAASQTKACPICDSAVGRQVREGIFDQGFARNLAVTVAPFPFFLGLVVAIGGGVPWPRRRTTRRDGHPAGDVPAPADKGGVECNGP